MIKGSRRSPYQRRRPSRAFPAAVALALIAAAGLAYFYLSDGGGTASNAPSHSAPPSVSAPPSEPLEGQPLPDAEGVDGLPPVAAPIPLPAIDESDPLIRELLAEAASRQELRSWLGTSELARRFVAAVANVAEGESPREQLRFLAPEERFRVVQKDGHLVADPRSHARYDLAAEVFASLDVPATVRAYRLLQPLFEEAFTEETLDRAIQELLAAPRIEGAVRLQRVGSFYEYPDEELEGLSAAQRHLLRMGPRNALRIQTKLREFQSALGLAEG
jgi:hypothetical protein